MDYTAAEKAALPKRSEAVKQLRETTFDVLVIGGGITGAGIALDAASRGLSVGLIEKGDYASGTSSKSTKLIHGGLRYLKQLDVALVREVGQERANVHRLAPHLVQPEKMLIPIIKDGQMGKMTTNMALWVYDFLADVRGDDKRRMLDREETLTAEPMLRDEWVEGGAVYAEYRTDDARLTVENVKTASALGAVTANYVMADELLYVDGKAVGAKARDVLTNETFDVKASVVVSAAGPWVDLIRKKDKSLTAKRIFHAKGVHLVVPHERFPVKQSIYFDLPDGRMCFAIQRDRSTYFGTTDTPFKTDPDHVGITAEDVSYLLDGVNRMFKGLELKADEIESSWAGLRPLIFEEGKSASEMSRKDEIFESESGLLSIAGGKLTGYRKMSERIMDKVVDRLGRGGETKTQTLALGGNGFKDFSAVIDYREVILDFLSENDLPLGRAGYLLHLYGKQAESILKLAPPEGSAELRLAIAELKFAYDKEQVMTLEDWAIRRTGRMYFDKTILDQLLPTLSNVFAGLTDQSEEERSAALLALQQLSTDHHDFGIPSIA
ncbi:MAG: glycerol-3-phosphate dehydrogenase/oxidase [Saprospiraceae bacterium]